MGEIFEDQIFCPNVHKGNVKRAPSRPIVGPMQVLNVNRTRSFGLHARACFTTSKNSGRILHILVSTKRIKANVAVQAKLIWDVGSEKNVFTTRAPVHHGCGLIMLSLH
jgi:hypothetical protein